jgi:alkylation response protein AidB-like acyl-CoA dehydrogenase
MSTVQTPSGRPSSDVDHTVLLGYWPVRIMKLPTSTKREGGAVSHYKSNIRDIEFNLFEVLGRDEVLGSGPFGEVDGETARSILAEVDRLAREDLAASFVDADRNPPVFDPTTNTAPLPESFKKSYQAWMDAEYWRLTTMAELGGTPAPASFCWAMGELVLGANPAIWMYGAGPMFAGVVQRNGNERDRKIAQLMIDKGWVTTMVLTEPDAGSDVGAGRSKATPNDDGTWNIEGVKRFITSAESDLSDNVIHMVLARPVGVEGAGGPGTKGLSLFIVPKFHFDLETGELGERNGAYVTNVEHKMGIKVSNTCEVTFGDPSVGGGEPAVGYLLGEVHNGIAQMFQVIENARMMVGTKAIATLSTGYLNALDYAKERVQGADLAQSADKTAPRVTITHHPDVRRSLMTQKSFAEAMRALVLYTASWQDRVQIAEHNGERDELAEKVNDLLLPIVKGYGSERSWVLLGTESLQTFGGSGFLQEYPIEQYVRDAKIDTLYEGTTAIQGQDFFFRKIVKDQGKALGHLAGEIQSFVDSEAGNGRLKVERQLLATALEDANAIVGAMINDLMSADASSEGGDIRNIYKVGLNTSRLLMVLGDVVCGWLLLRQAEIALEKLGGDPGKDKAFYEGKVAAAQFFAQNLLPKISAERAIAESMDLSLMDLDEISF